MVTFGFNFKKNNVILDVKVCKNIFNKITGLMCRKNSPPLLFIFKKSVKTPIHSFFCKPFVAIWFNKNKVIDVKLVKPWRLSIKPDSKFDKILEIPSSDKNFALFTDENRKL